MNLVRKIIGFKTKNMFLGELVTHYKEGQNGKIMYGAEPFEPRKYIIVKHESYSPKSYGYKDIFTGSSYNLFGNCNFKNEIVIRNLCSAVSNKSRTRYKDAEEMLNRLNSTYIKKK